MKRLLWILCVVAGGNALAATSDSDPEAKVREFLDGFNSGDIEAVEAAQLSDVIIVDEFAPFQWQGDGAFKAWLGDLTKHDTAAGVTNAHMARGDTIREEVSGDHAYIVVATVYSFDENGVPMKAAAQMTFALERGDTGWRISAWTYSAPGATPVAP